MPRPNKSQIIIEDGTNLLLKKYKLVSTGNTRRGTIWFFDVDNHYYVDADILIDKEMQKAFGYALNNRILSEIKGHIRRLTNIERNEYEVVWNTDNPHTSKYTPKYQIGLRLK